MKKEGGDAGRWFGVDFVAVLSVTPKNFSQDASPREENNNNGFGPESLFSGSSFFFFSSRTKRQSDSIGRLAGGWLAHWPPIRRERRGVEPLPASTE